MARVFDRVHRRWMPICGSSGTAKRCRPFARPWPGPADPARSVFGLHPAVERILPHADLLLLTSRPRASASRRWRRPACGVPAVAPRIGGLPEMIGNGTSGLLYEAGDEAAAARAVLRLIGDRENSAG